MNYLLCIITFILTLSVYGDPGHVTTSQQLDRLIEKSDFSSSLFFDEYQQLKKNFPHKPSVTLRAKLAIIESAIALNAHNSQAYPNLIAQLNALLPQVDDEQLAFSLKSQLFFMRSFENDELAYYHQVKELLRQAPENTKLTAYGYLLLDAANSALRILRNEEGWEYFSLAHQFAMEIDNNDFWSSFENSRGLALAEYGHIDEALEAFKKALAYKKQLGVNHAVIYANIAYNYFGLEQLEATLDYAGRALGQANKEQNRYVEVLILTLLGRVAHSQHDYEKAVDWFSQSLILAQQEDVRDYVFAAYADSIYPLLHLGKIEQAQMHLSQAKALASSDKLRVDGYLLELEAVVMHHKKEYAQSMALFLKAIDAVVKKYSDTAAKTAEQSRALMETQIQEAENQKLRLENELKQTFLDEISEKNQWLIWLSSIVSICMIVLIVLIFYVRQIAKKHHLQATTDELTQIPNRRCALSRLKKHIASAKKTSKPLVIGMLDIDYFKKINDKYGHLVGDTVLVEVAKVCQQRLSSPDFIGRLGGEEFLIVLNNVSEQVAIEKMELIRQTIESIQFLGPELSKLSVSASVGMTTLLDNDSQIELLIHRADIALYFAKEQGRNQIQAFKPAMLV